MTEPEIARRCHACGASIRDHAAFCPQCGKELKTTAELNSGPAGATTVVDTAPLQEPPSPQEPPKIEKSVDTSSQQSQESSVTTPLVQATPAAEPGKRSGTEKSSAGKHGAQLVAGARDKVQRATGIAKHVGGDVVQRGHKLREISSVVLDEASYDPSLRFVLVAAALFLLFLIMVLLNRFIV